MYTILEGTLDNQVFELIIGGGKSHKYRNTFIEEALSPQPLYLRLGRPTCESSTTIATSTPAICDAKAYATGEEGRDSKNANCVLLFGHCHAERNDSECDSLIDEEQWEGEPFDDPYAEEMLAEEAQRSTYPNYISSCY